MVATDELEKQPIFLPHHFAIVQGNVWTIVLDDGKETKTTYKLDSSQSPKHLERENPASKLIGIYKLEGDMLTICYGFKGRPRDFAITQDENRMVVVYKRVKSK